MDTQTRLTAHDLFTRVQAPWGGATVTTHGGEAVPDGIDAYAVTIKPEGVETISLPEDATEAQFTAAYDSATALFTWAPFVGVFHDDAKGTIDIDPVAVVSDRGQVDSLAEIYPVVGGAYNFATGEGYWPTNSVHNAITYMN